jgi:hypothetical protein
MTRPNRRSGQAITEYVVMLGITLPLVFWLFHPDNPLYTALRAQYNLITVLLLYPGP